MPGLLHGTLAALALLAVIGAPACKEKSHQKEQPAPLSPPASAMGVAAPETVAESCKLVCDHQTACLGVPEFASECAQICRDQAALPEQAVTLLVAHKRIISECFALSCSEFDPCFRQVIAQETARVAQAVGAAANIELTPEARRSFKELFCKVVKDSGGSLPNIADPNASADIKNLNNWIEMLAPDPTALQSLLSQAEAECNHGAPLPGLVPGSSGTYEPGSSGKMETDYYALAFESTLSMDEMLVKLEALGYGKWHERSKDAWGDYLFGHLNDAPHLAVAKLLEEDGHFVLDIKFDPEKPDGQAQYAAVREAVSARILPALGASAITRVEYIE